MYNDFGLFFSMFTNKTCNKQLINEDKAQFQAPLPLPERSSSQVIITV